MYHHRQQNKKVTKVVKRYVSKEQDSKSCKLQCIFVYNALVLDKFNKKDTDRVKE